MMPSFADPKGGCVAGRLIYVDPAKSRVGRGARSYWSYETFLKRHESRVLSLMGALGSWMLERAGVRSRMLALPQYFVLSNLAALIAFYQFLRGERYAHWEPHRESESTRSLAPTIAPHQVQ